MGFLEKMRLYWNTKIRKFRIKEEPPCEFHHYVDQRSEIFFHPADAYQSLRLDFESESGSEGSTLPLPSRLTRRSANYFHRHKF